MAAAHSGASVVVVDPKAQAEFRDQQARDALARAKAPNLALLSLQGLAHTVPYTVQVVVDMSQSAPSCNQTDHLAKLQAIVDVQFKMVDEVLNDYNPNSEVSKLNKAAVNLPVPVSPHLLTVLTKARMVTQMTGGSFDVAVAPLHDYMVEALKRQNGVLRPEAKIEMQRRAAFSHFDTAWKLDGKTMTKLHPEARLMLGAISKGYTVDVIVDAVKAAGYKHGGLVEWGGDVKAYGRNHREDLWKVGIITPPTLAELREKAKHAGSVPVSDSPPKYLCLLELDDAAVCTSGDYENFILPGHLWTHTVCFDKWAPMNAELVPGIAQCSVVSNTCMVADALSTAALTKTEISRARGILERFRYHRDCVHDFVVYVRDGDRVARMHEIATESLVMRKERISQCLPARVVVVGGGLAGVCAAIEAANCGANVILLEKTKVLGGNSAKATSGINGWGTRPQAMKGVLDDGKYFERDTYLSGLGGRCDPGLVSTLSIKSSEAIAWLMKTTGLSLTTLFQLGGHSRPRTHRVPDSTDGKPVPVGYTIMSTLAAVLKTRYDRRITVLTECSATSLISERVESVGESARVKVTGVKYTEADGTPNAITADAIILTTGGFSCDVTSPNSLVKEFAPHLLGTATTNGPFATGDGVKMARAIGATLVDMDKIQLHPTGFVDPKNPANNTKFLGPEALRGSGGILLNSKGERFVNELDLRSVVSAAIQKQGTVYPESNGCQVAYCVLNQAAIQLFGKAQLGFYKDKAGLFKDAATVADLAAIIGCPAEAVQQTLAKYEQACKAGRCAATGKTVFPSVIGAEGPFVVAVITPVLHYTMGGVSISPSAEVQMDLPDFTFHLGHRKPILGLFAAGEVSAGVHGGNRLGGNSLLECVVFGRVAGDRAATILQPRKEALSPVEWRPVTVREIREGGDFGQGSRIIRFNLPGALQLSGLQIGQFVAIRGEWDGQALQGFYSPITLPNDYGVIGLLVRTDKGVLKEWLSAMKPGASVLMRACGGLAILRNPSAGTLNFHGRAIRNLGLIAGGTGIAPMLQIVRAALKRHYIGQIQSIKLIYAAETEEELTYRTVLQNFEKHSDSKFQCYFCLNNPPPGWFAGVGFVDRELLKQHMVAPSNDSFIVICGPPPMQRAVKGALIGMGHAPMFVKTVDEEPPAASKL